MYQISWVSLISNNHANPTAPYNTSLTHWWNILDYMLHIWFLALLHTEKCKYLKKSLCIKLFPILFWHDITFFENLMLNCEAEKFVNDEKKMSFDKRFCVIRNYFYSWIYVSWNTCTNVRCESPHTYRGKEKERYTVHDCQETHHY